MVACVRGGETARPEVRQTDVPERARGEDQDRTDSRDTHRPGPRHGRHDNAHEDVRALTLRTPFAAKDEIDLFESASELTIRIGNFKRKVMLPDVLRRQRVTSARRDGETLVIHFSGKESEHEA